MGDILDRLRKRIYPDTSFFTSAIGANACAAASTVVQGRTGTFTTGGPDKDVQDAIAEIKRLRKALQFYAKHAGEYANVAIDALKD